MSLGTSEPSSAWLARWRRVVDVRAEILAVMHDVDGALHAGQWGLVASACRELVSAATRAWLYDRRVDLPSISDPVAQWRVTMEMAEAVVPGRAASAWSLYLADVEPATAARHVDRVCAFVGDCLGLGGPLTLVGSIRHWADANHALRATYARLQVPLSDDWYIVGQDTADWYAVVVRALESYD